MRLITTSYLIFIVCLEGSYSYFTLSGFQECENSPASSFKDGDIALLCEGEQDEGGICKLNGYSHGLEVVFNLTVGKGPYSTSTLKSIFVTARAFGNDTSGEGIEDRCLLANERGEPLYHPHEGEKVNVRCKVPFDLSGNSLGVIGRLTMNFDQRFDQIWEEIDGGISDPKSIICATHVVQWI